MSQFKSGNITKQIVSGSEAGECEFPYMAFLLMDLPDGVMTACGGALLDSVHVLTAAHCINNIVGVTAHFGHANNMKAPQIIKASSWTSHEGYQSGASVLNDVGMIRLEKPVKLGRCVKTIALPRKNQLFSGTCIAAGWGKMSNAEEGPDHMRKATVDIISNKECQRHYYDIFQDKHICIGDRSHLGKNICSGDSGSPLMCKSGRNYVVAGVASYVFDCDSGFGVYANVAGLLDWVKEVQKTL